MRNKLLFLVAVFLCFTFTGFAKASNKINPAEYVNICTFNMRHDLKSNEPDSISWDEPTNRKLRVLNLIGEYNFDIIGAQEVTFNQIEDIITLPYKDYGLEVKTGNRTANGLHNSIFYKSNRFITLDQGSFWLSETPDQVSRGWDADQYRNCSWLKLKDVKTSKVFYYFNAHFDHMGVQARANSARLIINKIAQIAGRYPALFMGDLNSIETSEPISILNAGLNDSRVISLTPPTGPYGIGHGWRIDSNVRRIDYIYIYNGNGNERIEVQEYEVIDKTYDGKAPSDHWPVRIKFRIVSGLSAYAVTSALDDGSAGTLRHVIASAQAGDSIYVDRTLVDTIKLTSPVTLQGNIKINVNGAVVQVEEAGKSAYRIFTIGTNSEKTDSISLYNATFIGGDISGLSSSNGNGGIMFINKNVSLYVEDVIFQRGKAVYGGAIHCNDSIKVKIVMERCSFLGNEATNNAGAFYVKAVARLNQCSFLNNKTSSNGSALTTNHKVFIRNTEFKNNSAIGRGAYGGAIFNTSGGQLTVENCSFWRNSGVTASTLYNRTGTLNLIHCTIAGNFALTQNAPAYLDDDATNVSSNLLNNIFTYNYHPSGFSDLTLANQSTTNGSGNIISNVNQIQNLQYTITFNYGSNEPSLFLEKTIINGKSVPVFQDNGGYTKTIALSGSTSIAYATATINYKGFVHPTTDQRGVARNVQPCIGAFEYVTDTGLKSDEQITTAIYPNPAQNHMFISTDNRFIKADLYSLSGTKLTSFETQNCNLSFVSKGTYLVKIHTTKGMSIEKLIIK